MWSRYIEAGEQKTGWTRLSDTVYAEGTWIRVGFDLDYTSNLAEGPFCRVKINGSRCMSERGVRSPTDMASPGCWHRMGVAAAAAPSELALRGTSVDDVIMTAEGYKAEHSGPVATNGIEFAWFDRNGLPRDPDRPSPYHAGKTLGYLHDSGLNPYDTTGEPFTLKDFAVTPDGSVQILFNGYKGDSPAAGFSVYESSTPDFSRKTDITASGTMEGDGETWTTVWEGSVDSGDNAANARFFRVEAQRVRSGEAK
jgi:hypothetical protein